MRPSSQESISTLAKVQIESDVFDFNPTRVETKRPDLFNSSHFSLFDVLVHLGERNKINLNYHFDGSLNTFVVDSINGEENWWYDAWYDGGWPERNVFRMDHYPWKEGTTLRFFREDPSNLAGIFDVFRAEVFRRNRTEGLIIPKVIIRGRTFFMEFKNVTVTPHNIRDDVLAVNVTTALDVILSLGDQGEITYELKWYDSIGRAEIVRSYWVDSINSDDSFGSCGFVYEAGSTQYHRFRGNHIHIPADLRLLNSPEYVEFFWICI
jgi:hypothetical protein